MPVGALIGGVASAAASVGGSLIQSNAASQASQQQVQMDQQALAQQKQMFNTAQNALSPYYTAAQSALPALQGLITPGTSASVLSTLPGFQFQSQWGDLQATNQLAAEGLGGSAGPVGKALSDYNQGLAGTYYMNAVGSLQNFANMGSGAAGALAGDAISSGNSQASTTQAAGNALASGTLGSANALSSGLSGASGGLTNALLMSKLLGGSGGIYGALQNMNLGNVFGTNSIGMPNF